MKPFSPILKTWLRRLRWPLYGLLALYLLYLIAANGLINSGRGQALLNRKPERFQMHWSGGYTLWPGRLVLRGLEMRGHVHKLTWALSAEHVRGQIALVPLLQRQVQIPWVTATGLQGEVRQAADEMPPALHSPEKKHKAWRLDIARIKANNLRQFAFHDWQIVGAGEAEASLVKQFAGGAFELRPSVVRFGNARILQRQQLWLHEAQLQATFSLPAHVPADYRGLARLEILKLALQAEGKTPGFAAQLDEQGRYQFQMQDEAGTLAADVQLVAGRLQPGSRLHLNVPLAMTQNGVREQNDLQAEFSVSDSIHLNLNLPKTSQQLPSLTLQARLPDNRLPLSQPRALLGKLDGRLQGQGYLPSIGGLVALFARADWFAMEGSGHVEVDLALKQGRLEAGSQMKLRQVRAHLDALGNRFAGQADAQARILAGKVGTEDQSQLDVQMQSFSVAPLSQTHRPYISGNALQVQMSAIADLMRMRESLQARLRFQNARIPDLSRFNPHLPNDKLSFIGGSGTASGDLSLRGDGSVDNGQLQLYGRAVQIGMAGMRFRGDLQLDGRLRRGNLQRGEFALAGSRIRLSNVAFSEPGGSSSSGWWAEVNVQDGRVSWKKPAAISGRINARMKDVGFLLAMFAARSHYPQWVTRVVDEGQAYASGRVAWRGNLLVLDDMAARNDRFSVNARLRLQGSQRQGDLLLGWGKLEAGLELQGERRELHLLRARQWYQSRRGYL
ncbi:hypothetical protein CO614_07320 [Lysobacteraceae bacterium NML120232]|nr:hypothetical protein CO614_07320 [Xanthomonadaceae bacterium NML120232]